MNAVAIVGAGGQIGAHLLAHFRVAGVPAWGICRNEITAAPLRLRGFEVRSGSITDAAARDRLFGDADVIVNCAAATGMPAQARVANDALLEALLAATGGRRILHFSSVAVYGSCIQDGRNTFAQPRPDAVYGIDKLRLERDLHRKSRRTKHSITILRLGHVYGAGQWLSRFVLGALVQPQRRLPFDGQRPSNAVHVKHVAAAVGQAVAGWQPGTRNVFDLPSSTWRDLFDWHSHAVGLHLVSPMSAELSEHYAALHRRQAARGLSGRAFADVRQWLRGSPRALISMPGMKQFGVALLSRYRLLSLERRMLLLESRSKSSTRGASVPEPYLFCDAAPGPQVEYEAARSGADATALAAWYRAYSDPESLLDWQRVARVLDAAPA